MERLTAADLMEWTIYIEHFGTPMRRADINSALERVLWCENAKLDELIPQYGQKREIPTQKEVVSKLLAWGKMVSRGK